MSLSTTPARARTDAPDLDAGTPLDRGTTSARLVRLGGVAVATGSASWAAGVLAFGLTPEPGWRAVVGHGSALLFQLGLAALVTVQLRTGATGTGRLARSSLYVEHVLLTLAMTSTLTWMFMPGSRTEAWFAVLDMSWPISMVGMFAISIRIAIAGRWKGAARFWPLVAESWAPVVVPVSVLLPALAPVVGAAHLLVGYVVLGVVLATRPELTGAHV